MWNDSSGVVMVRVVVLCSGNKLQSSWRNFFFYLHCAKIYDFVFKMIHWIIFRFNFVKEIAIKPFPYKNMYSYWDTFLCCIQTETSRCSQRESIYINFKKILQQSWSLNRIHPLVLYYQAICILNKQHHSFTELKKKKTAFIVISIQIDVKETEGKCHFSWQEGK